MSPNLSRLERKLGYSFKDQDLMILALTHRSFAGRNNERLEFLGDAILNFVAGEALFERFPQAREGQLSRLRARLVKGETLAVLARGFELGEYLRLGSGELKSGGFRRESILADALEALIGAIYLDAGMDAARERVLDWLTGELDGLTLVDTNKDPKTRLQEFLQSRACELPRYEVVDIQGEPHCRTFMVECQVALLNEKTLGQGGSRRIAEQVAGGAVGLKLHEDWGTTPAAIDCCLSEAEKLDVQVAIHTDTLNESGFVEASIEAFKGRTIHTYHSEGAGGGHAPDILKVCGEPNVLPSSTNPTRPFTVNTLDEHLDMLMVCHHLDKNLPEDVAFAESSTRISEFEDVANSIVSKMISRHPHVFGDGDATTTDGVNQTWEKIMAAERARKAEDKGHERHSALDGVASALPALMRAEKLTKRAARVGFDWPSTDEVFDKLHEEIDELKAEMTENPDPARLQDELGDMLFVMANLARKIGVDPEVALRGANHKFTKRFHFIEDELARDGRSSHLRPLRIARPLLPGHERRRAVVPELRAHADTRAVW